MQKKHDENKCLRSVSRVCKISYADKTLLCKDKNAVGIHTWGKIDFLTKYCGWYFIYDKTAGTGGYIGDDSKPSVRESKKMSKEHKLTDKRK